MDIILKPFAWLLLLFYNLVSNYGAALVLFAILVKLILFPMSLKGKRGMIQMNMLSGEMKKLQKQYGNNKEKYNEEVQKLYEREKVNPMSGCLWSFLPLAVLLPLYSIIRQPMKYMMDLSAQQISNIAEALKWSTVSVEKGWVKGLAEGASNAYTAGAYNELYLASMINESNLATVQAAAGEGGRVFALNFDLFGLDLSQIPTWNFWANGADWNTIGLFLLVVVSALTSILFSVISQKTNSVNQQSEQAAQTNKSMMLVSPILSLWIGFMMPALLCVYWIANNVLSLVQEVICGKLLKKDYEEAARIQAENAAREKEEEKRLKREKAERRARELEENKGKKKPVEKKDGSVGDASRVGMRHYARGRAYDPNRYGGVTPYRGGGEEMTVEEALAYRETPGEPVTDERTALPTETAAPEETAATQETVDTDRTSEGE